MEDVIQAKINLFINFILKKKKLNYIDYFILMIEQERKSK